MPKPQRPAGGQEDGNWSLAPHLNLDGPVTYREMEFPRQFGLVLLYSELPARALLMVEVTPDRGAVAVGLRSNYCDERNTPASYRDIDRALGKVVDLADLLTQGMIAAQVALTRSRLQDEGISGPERLKQMEQARAQASGIARPRRRHIVTPEFLEEVAVVYRRSLSAGEPPTVAVEKRWGSSHSTAARWVGMARKAGKLGEGSPGKAGEQGSEDR